MAEAVELKNKGNEAFKNKKWPEALSYYSQAIEKNDKEPSFFTNRAQVGGAYLLRQESDKLTLNAGTYQT